VDYSTLLDRFGFYCTSDVLGIIVALLALLITFNAVSIPTMILATADFQKSFFDMVTNPECLRTMKKDGLVFEIKELSKRNLENALFMNLVYRIT
jgi:hypothetical protein